MANIRTYRRNLTSDWAGLRVLCASSTVLQKQALQILPFNQ